MEVSTANAAGSPKKITLSGKSYMVSPANDEDYGVLENWVQDKMLQVAIRNAKNIQDPNERRAFLDHAFDKTCIVTITSFEATILLASLEGSAMRLWIGIRKNHPEVSFEEIKKAACNPEEVEALMLQVVAMDRPKALYNKKDKTPKNLQRRRRNNQS